MTLEQLERMERLAERFEGILGKPTQKSKKVPQQSDHRVQHYKSIILKKHLKKTT